MKLTAKARSRFPSETIEQREFARMLGVNRKTIWRWRSEGRYVNGETIILHSFSTSPGRPGSKVLIPLSYCERRVGIRRLGAAEFVEALGVDPALAHYEAEMLAL